MIRKRTDVQIAPPHFDISVSVATLVVAVLTLLAALAALGFGIHHHKNDIRERDSDRKRQLRESIIQAALELNENARTSRIIAAKTLEERGYLMSQAQSEALKRGMPRLKELADMAAEMQKTYEVDDSTLSLEHLESELSKIRGATLEVGEVKLIIEIFTKR